MCFHQLNRCISMNFQHQGLSQQEVDDSIMPLLMAGESQPFGNSAKKEKVSKQDKWGQGLAPIRAGGPPRGQAIALKPCRRLLEEIKWISWAKRIRKWARRMIIIPNIDELIRLWSNFSMQQFTDSSTNYICGEAPAAFPGNWRPPQKNAKRYKNWGGGLSRKAPLRLPNAAN